MKIATLLLMFAAFAQAVQSLDTVTTPEPRTIILLATGLAGIGFAAWRRNRNK